MGAFRDPLRAGIAVIRALAGLDPRTPGEPTVARIAVIDEAGTEIMRVEITEAGVENAVNVLEAAADRADHEARMAALEPSEWSAAAVAYNHSQVYADVEDLFGEVDPASYLDDIVGADSPEAAQAAYEQLVTGEWDGEL